MAILIETKNMFAVWKGANGRRPSHFYDTEERARDEAKRLAQLNPGVKFHVVHFIVKISDQPVNATAVAGSNE